MHVWALFYFNVPMDNGEWVLIVCWAVTPVSLGSIANSCTAGSPYHPVPVSNNIPIAWGGHLINTPKDLGGAHQQQKAPLVSCNFSS